MNNSSTTNSTCKNRIIFMIVPYFGKWPKWFPFYLKSISFNPEICWKFYTDYQIPKEFPDNCSFFKLSLEDFNRLATHKIGIQINIQNPYKVCDLRPAFGKIFEDDIKNCDFWGHTDIDIIYGNIKKFITDDILNQYEIITASKFYLLGHFTLYKNLPKINNLYKKSPDFYNIFTNKKHFSFDEFGTHNYPVIWKEKVNKKEIENLKKNNMTWIVKSLTRKKKVKSFFGDFYKWSFGNYYGQSGDIFKKYIYHFENGTLIDDIKKNEVIDLHFEDLKNFLSVPKYDKKINNFYITNYEIFYNKEMPFIKKIFKMIVWKTPIYLNSLVGKIGIIIKKISPKAYKFLKNKI